jgi:hypothetical protein
VTASTRAVGSKSEMIGPTKCESLINVVNSNKPKVLTGLNQKGSDRSRNSSLSWRRQECHRRTGEAYVINVVRKRNVEIPYVSRFRVGVLQAGLMDVRGQDDGRSEGCPAMGQIGVASVRQHHLTRKRANVHRVARHENEGPTGLGNRADVGRQEIRKSCWCGFPLRSASAPAKYREVEANALTGSARSLWAA